MSTHPSLCSTFVAGAIALALPAHAGIVDIADFQGVNVYESTYLVPHPAVQFAAGDSRLTAVLTGAALSGSSRDFGFFVGDENYDI